MSLDRTCVLVALGVLAACGSDTTSPSTEGPAESAVTHPEAPAPPPSCEGSACSQPPAAATPPGPLRVRFLGVGGFLVEHGGEALLTAPLFTRPNMFQVTAGTVSSDAALVEQNLPTSELTNVRAILSGHAHYDHLLDVPAVMTRATNATLYSNRSAKNLLAAFAPDRAEACAAEPAAATPIARSRVVAVDDPAKSVVDYRACPSQRPEGAPLEGTWVRVPGTHMRVLAVCSEHPDQVGPFHFAPGSVDEEQCTPPKRADGWKEGATIAFLVDFLDPKTDAATFRLYYQDAPTNAPVGHVPTSVLGGKRVDVALLCVGSSNAVDDAPAATIAALAPRYALGGHWEDFLRAASDEPKPIPMLDVKAWGEKARAALPLSGEPSPLRRNGKDSSDRAVLPNPGDAFEIAF